ncbi:low affinity immunoglobulin epsilon Fc receptor-like [Saccostrea cucullata]|uniref:low affinity immunoglobulin epsilon Fc receptor-like n=1 Tax=Saccostrea cuccullata TaxID=36930 RepID=UPI002ED388A6
MEAIRELRISQSNMEIQIKKILKREMSSNKEQDIKLLPILERMQSEITKLEKTVTNATKETHKPGEKVTNLTNDWSTKSCPSNWEKFGSSCYKIIALAKSWDIASIKCLQYGAKLVEIETREENYFLKQKITNYDKLRLYWIGGTDEIIEGRFVWASTGRSLTFTDWNKGEPNNDKSQEDYIEISTHPDRTGMWNDSICSHEFYFICEKKL